MLINTVSKFSNVTEAMNGGMENRAEACWLVKPCVDDDVCYSYQEKKKNKTTFIVSSGQRMIKSSRPN